MPCYHSHHTHLNTFYPMRVPSVSFVLLALSLPLTSALNRSFDIALQSEPVSILNITSLLFILNLSVHFSSSFCLCRLHHRSVFFMLTFDCSDEHVHSYFAPQHALSFHTGAADPVICTSWQRDFSYGIICMFGQMQDIFHSFIFTCKYQVCFSPGHLLCHRQFCHGSGSQVTLQIHSL